MVIVWEVKVAHRTHVWKREKKSAVKRTNNLMKESKTELATHISKGGNCLSQPKTGPLFMS